MRWEFEDWIDGYPFSVVLIGPKGVGKATLAREWCDRVLDLDDPSQARLADADYSLAGQRGENGTLAVLEWGRVPTVWDSVRRDIDDNGPGIVLTQSFEPQQRPSHSGAGRISRSRHGPQGWFRRGLPTPTATVSVSGLFDHQEPELGNSPFTLADYLTEACRSGFPTIRDLDDPAAGIEEYVNTWVLRDGLDAVERAAANPAHPRAWLAACAAEAYRPFNPTVIHHNTHRFLPDGTAPVTAGTNRRYLDGFDRLHLLTPLPAWRPHAGVKTPRRGPLISLVDPAFEAHLLGHTPDTLIAGADGDGIERLFTGLADLTIRDAIDHGLSSLAHLAHHTTATHGTTFVITNGSDHLALHPTMRTHATPELAATLRRLKAQVEQVEGQRMTIAAVTAGRYAYTDDGLHNIPLACLTP